MIDRLETMIQSVITAIIGFIALSYFWKLPESYWLVLSALILIQVRLEVYYLKTLLAIGCVGLVLVLNVVIANYLSATIYILAGYLFTTTFYCVYLSLKKSKFFLPAFMINMLGIYAAGLNFSWVLELQRCELILMGMLIVLLLRSFVWPVTLKNQSKRLYRQWLDSLEALKTTIFQMYLKRDYSETMFFYEKKLHQDRFLCFDLISQMRSCMDAIKLSRLESITEWMTTLGNLRYRIKDFTTLEVCEKELMMTSKAVTAALNCLRNNEQIPHDESVIAAFEEIYQTTLQIITNEPYVFLVFINDVKQLLIELGRVNE